MQAVRFYAHGGPDVLRIEDVADPQAGPGEVLVRLHARGINRAEILTVQGIYPRVPTLPAIPGREGAGVVVGLGAGVDDMQVGDRVMLQLGSSIDTGTWCELVRVRREHVLRTPKNLDDAQAGGAMVSYLTAWCGVQEVLGLRPGDSLIVTAAVSPTGLAVLDLCKHLGIRVFATTRRPERSELLQHAGAEQVFVEGRDDLVRGVRRATAGVGAHACFDAVSGDLGRACFKAMREGGTLLQYGSLSLGPIIANPGTLIFKQKRVEGFWLTRALEVWDGARVERIYRTLQELFASGALVPRVHACYELAEAEAAFREMNALRHIGKVILTSTFV